MSDEQQWIVFPRWDGKDGFQHYRNRDPIWIKNYIRLTSDDEYRNLSFSDRGLLHGLWLEYARSGRALKVDTVSLSRRLGQRVFSAQLERLNYAGLLDFSASKPLAPRYQDASPDKEGDKEPPTPADAGDKTFPRGKSKSRRAKSEAGVGCTHCGIRFKAQPLLDEHLYHSHDGPEPAHWADTALEPEPLPLEDDEDLPAPEERQRIAAAIRSQVLGGTNGSEPETPWEGDEPPVVE